jgi:hypothetical protein
MITTKTAEQAHPPTKLKDKLQNALDESRILILVTQVMIGFQYRAPFEKKFLSLPQFTQYLHLSGHFLLLLTLALLILPASYHRLVEKGEDSNALLKLTSRAVEIALLPFALALGINIYLAAERSIGRSAAIIAAGAMLLLALLFWYALEWLQRARQPTERGRHTMRKAVPEKAKLKDKIKQVLTEARMILPGAQALLGFQFAIILLESFDQLPTGMKTLHFASLCLIALSTILLITPAAYHRIVEQGENDESFHRLASRFILAATIPLALGISGDLWLVVKKVTNSLAVANVATGCSLVLFYSLWLGVPLYARAQHDKSP